MSSDPSRPQTTASDPLSYLEDRISAILLGKPVRDLGEAISAVRHQIKQLTRDRDALFLAHAHEMVRADIAEGNGASE